MSSSCKHLKKWSTNIIGPDRHQGKFVSFISRNILYAVSYDQATLKTSQSNLDYIVLLGISWTNKINLTKIIPWSPPKTPLCLYRLRPTYLNMLPIYTCMFNRKLIKNVSSSYCFIPERLWIERDAQNLMYTTTTWRLFKREPFHIQ